MLVQFPAVCFVGALIADLAYWRTTMYLWETFSVWLLAAGCCFGAIAGITGLVSWCRHRYLRQVRHAGLHALASLAAMLVAVINTFVHSRDGYTAVVPLGLALSVIVVFLMLLATWFGWPRRQLVRVGQQPSNVGAIY